jgi:hypothetical protein
MGAIQPQKPPAISLLVENDSAKHADMPAWSLLKRIYFRIPVLRQVCQIREHLIQMRREQAALRTLEFVAVEEALRVHPRYGNPLRLHGAGFRAFSQNNEDGMIAEIFRRIEAPTKTFVEIGVGDGAENNTRYLLLTGWRGWWFEGDKNNAGAIRKSFRRELGHGQLRLHGCMLRTEELAAVLAENGVPEQPDLLSVDVDQLTYYFLDALSFLKPRVIVVEYNAAFRPPVDWVVPADNETWDGSANFGASLVAFERLGRERGYVLVGCDLAGVNAFFVRAELAEGKFLQPYDAATHYEPPRFGGMGHAAGPVHSIIAP